MPFVPFLLFVATATQPLVIPVEHAPTTVAFRREAYTSTGKHQVRCDSSAVCPTHIICHRDTGRLSLSTRWTCTSRTQMPRGFTIKWANRNNGDSFVADSFSISVNGPNVPTASDDTVEIGFFKKLQTLIGNILLWVILLGVSYLLLPILEALLPVLWFVFGAGLLSVLLGGDGDDTWFSSTGDSRYDD